MKSPTKHELQEENKRLSQALSSLEIFMSDLLAGRVASRVRGDCQWFISRPGCPSGGLALTRSIKNSTWSLTSIDQAATLAHNPVFQNSFEDGAQGWTENYDIANMAQAIQNDAMDASFKNNIIENRIGLTVDLRGFKPVKVM